MANSTTTKNPHHQIEKHIAVCAFPFGTHSGPLLHLVQRLSEPEPNIRFSFFNTARSNATLFTTTNTKAYPNIVPCSFMPEDDPLGNGDPLLAISRFIAAAPESLRREMAAAEAEVGMKFSCIISDAFLWFCYEFAREMGVPSWIALWTSSPSSLSAHVHTRVIREHFGSLQGANTEEAKMADCIPGFSAVRYRELPPGIIQGSLDSPFNLMLHNMGMVMSKANVVVINCMDELLPTITNDLKSNLTLLLNIGPFSLTQTLPYESIDHFGCLPWLDNQRPNSVVYISFGTVATPPQPELVALAQALGDSGVPFIWSLNDKIKSGLPSAFLERVNMDKTFGMIVPWAPQSEILAHQGTGVFVTHCGWNSILESMVNGVPMICRPILGDQILNGHLVEVEYKFGIGVQDGVFTKDGMIEMLLRMLSSEDGKSMRERAKVLKELAENAIKPGGSSYVNFKTLLDIVKN